jgi:hypothetical protein
LSLEGEVGAKEGNVPLLNQARQLVLLAEHEAHLQGAPATMATPSLLIIIT